MNDEQRKAMWAEKMAQKHNAKIIFDKDQHLDKLPTIRKTTDYPKGHYGFNGIGNSQTEEYKKMMEDLEYKALEHDFENPIKHTLNYEGQNNDLKEIDRFNVKNRIEALQEAHDKGIKTKNSEHWLKFLKKYGNQFG